MVSLPSFARGPFTIPILKFGVAVFADEVIEKVILDASKAHVAGTITKLNNNIIDSFFIMFFLTGANMVGVCHFNFAVLTAKRTNKF